MELKKDQAYALSNRDIAHLLPDVPITAYPSFAQDLPLDNVVDEHGRGIVLFVKSEEGAVLNGHWLAVDIRPDKTVLLFDPYGGHTEPWQLNHTFVDGGMPELVEQGQARPLLAPYFRSHGYKPVYNHTRLQAMRDGISTCGRHCVVRLWRSDMGDAEYAKWLQSFPGPPDVIVTQMTEQALGR